MQKKRDLILKIQFVKFFFYLILKLTYYLFLDLSNRLVLNFFGFLVLNFPNCLILNLFDYFILNFLGRFILNLLGRFFLKYFLSLSPIILMFNFSKTCYKNIYSLPTFKTLFLLLFSLYFIFKYILLDKSWLYISTSFI